MPDVRNVRVVAIRNYDRVQALMCCLCSASMSARGNCVSSEAHTSSMRIVVNDLVEHVLWMGYTIPAQVPQTTRLCFCDRHLSSLTTP